MDSVLTDTVCTERVKGGEEGRDREREKETASQTCREKQRYWFLGPFHLGYGSSEFQLPTQKPPTSCKNPFWIYANCNRNNQCWDIPIALMRKSRFRDVVTKLPTIPRLFSPPSPISTHSLPILYFSHIELLFSSFHSSGLLSMLFSLCLYHSFLLIFAWLVFTYQCRKPSQIYSSSPYSWSTFSCLVTCLSFSVDFGLCEAKDWVSIAIVSGCLT